MAFRGTQFLVATLVITICQQRWILVRSSTISHVESIHPGNHDIRTRPDTISSLVGGALAEVGQFPWMAVIHQLLGGSSIAMCAGTVLSVRWVLTAGHCVANPPRKFLVVFGENDKRHIGYDFYQGPGVSMVTTKGALHPRYGKTVNDIALLYMPRDIPLGGVIRAIRLASGANENELLARKRATVIGWGKDGPHSIGTSYLKFGHIPIISNWECARSWNIDSSVICTAPRTNTDACEGDSGGPLVVRVNNEYFQIGIVSFGDGKCPSLLPGAFTRVASFTKWIEQVTGIKY